MATITINVDMDKRCLECGKKGAVNDALCLDCITRAIEGKSMKSEFGKRYAQRVKADIERRSRRR